MADSSVPRFRLARSQRMKTGRDFGRAKTHGQRVVVGCLIANWVAAAPGMSSRLGVITSRKIGEAVERTRARRLLRESFRLHQHDLERPVDLVLVARNSIAGKKFAAVEKDFLEAMRRGGLLKTVK
jgi:ribonuclease P protein component